MLNHRGLQMALLHKQMKREEPSAYWRLPSTTEKKKLTLSPSCRNTSHLNLIFLHHLNSTPHSLLITPHFHSPIMSSNDKPTVLIVGAGLGGLMLGALLEKSNVPYIIFERAAMVKPLGR